MNINQEQVSYFCRLMEDYGQTDYDLKENYSGRGMNGETCFGVVVSDVSHLSPVVLAMELTLKFDPDLDQDEGYSAYELMEILGMAFKPRTDNMGLDMIIYWPEIQVEA